MLVFAYELVLIVALVLFAQSLFARLRNEWIKLRAGKGKAESYLYPEQGMKLICDVEPIDPDLEEEVKVEVRKAYKGFEGNIESWNKTKLKQLAKDWKIPRYYKLRKNELIREIRKRA